MTFKTILDRLISLAENKISAKEIVFLSSLFFLSLVGFVFAGREYLAEKFLSDRILYKGQVTEGVIGSLSAIDPYSPQDRLEKDLSKLLFSGLAKKNSNSEYIPDLASQIVQGEDKLSYKVTLNSAATFHNGKKITPVDVIFSFNKDKTNKRDLERVEAIAENDSTIIFRLDKPYPLFLQELDFPIIPFEYSPVLSVNLNGSGPFKISNILKNEDGSLQEIQLTNFLDKKPKPAYLQNYSIKFFTNEEALTEAWKKGELTLVSDLRNSLLSQLKDKNSEISTTTMSSEFVLFLNQTKNENLKSTTFRRYISQNISRQQLVDQVFGGLGSAIGNLNSTSTILVTADDLAKAGFSLEEGKLFYKTKSEKDDKSTTTKVQVSIKISTLATPELQSTLVLLKQNLESLGIQVNTEVITQDKLSEVLKERNFDVFLFGFFVPSPSAYYNFFHSSQVGYPKLNLSGYANKDVDDILEKMKEQNQINDQESLSKLFNVLDQDMPVIFLYRPYFTALHNKDLKIILPVQINNIRDRYQFVTDWYTDTEKVFSIFQNSALAKFIETKI
jgi:peptide/nickel transport system substrate-binding protein